MSSFFNKIKELFKSDNKPKYKHSKKIDLPIEIPGRIKKCKGSSDSYYYIEISKEEAFKYMNSFRFNSDARILEDYIDNNNKYILICEIGGYNTYISFYQCPRYGGDMRIHIRL